ncbi:MAG: copper chaperone PCu(A)C [Paraglaciecola sp.]|uniref:copper chaperone PCu(A)C n=1 Tax=Paraglaciecola sp. TaxID=1920173 RepID=UPI00329A41BA
MNSLLKPFGAFLLFSSFSFSSYAHDFNAGKIEVNHPWARPTAPVVKTAAVYLVINNSSQETERLLSVEVPTTIAQQAQIHHTQYSQDMAKMREVRDGLLISAAKKIEFTPGGTHIMLVGLKTPLAKGDKFPLLMRFEHSGEITVEVWVEDKPSSDAANSHHSHH